MKFSSKEYLVVNGNEVEISIKSAPRRGQANAELIKKLARHFNVNPLNVRIVSGLTSRKKTVEIL